MRRPSQRIASDLRPVDRDFGADFYFCVWDGRQRECRPLGDLIDAHANFVAHAVGQYIDLASLRTATEDIRQRPETFERIAELPPTRRDIIRLIGDAHGIIQAPLQRIHGETRAIVLHTQRVGLVILRDGDHGRTVGLFGGIEGIVQEFFEDGERPAVAAHPELHGELALGENSRVRLVVNVVRVRVAFPMLLLLVTARQPGRRCQHCDQPRQPTDGSSSCHPSPCHSPLREIGPLSSHSSVTAAMASDTSPLLHQGMQPGFVLVHRVHQGRRQHACEHSTATASRALCQVTSPAALRHPISCSPGQSVRIWTIVTGASNRGVWSSHPPPPGPRPPGGGGAGAGAVRIGLTIATHVVPFLSITRHLTREANLLFVLGIERRSRVATGTRHSPCRPATTPGLGGPCTPHLMFPCTEVPVRSRHIFQRDFPQCLRDKNRVPSVVNTHSASFLALTASGE